MRPHRSAMTLACSSARECSTTGRSLSRGWTRASMRGRRYDALLKNISPFRLRRHTALLDRPLQHLPELSCVLMAVNLHRMLYGHFDEFLFIVGGYCDRAFALRRYLSTVDIF